MRRETMAINYQVLGEPGRDNALLVTVDSGQSQHRLLFDCGEGCLSKIPISQIQAIEAAFFRIFTSTTSPDSTRFCA
jgi:ribonuclease Z